MCLLMNMKKFLNRVSAVFGVFGAMNLYAAIWFADISFNLLMQGGLSLFMGLAFMLIADEIKVQKRSK